MADTNPSAGPDYLLRIEQVVALTTMGKTTIYRRMKAGGFPPAVQISPGLVRWRQSDVTAWLNSLGTSPAAQPIAAPQPSLRQPIKRGRGRPRKVRPQ